MTSFTKRFLVGSAVVASLAPEIALANPICAYVIGTVNGKTVTTPAQPVIVPGSEALTQPVTVHLDEMSQTIIGYSVTALRANDGNTSGSPVFVSGVAEGVPSISATVPDHTLPTERCVDFTGATVPAIPVKIPASTLTLPGAVTPVSGAVFNFEGNPFVAPGQLFTFDGRAVFIPAIDQATPAHNVTTPGMTITLDLMHPAAYLPPHD